MGFRTMSSCPQVRTAHEGMGVGTGEGWTGDLLLWSLSVPRFLAPLRPDACEVKVWVFGVHCILGSPQRSQSSLYTA